jgi:hypothetical protein
MENAASKVVFRLTHRQNLEPLAEWLFMGVMNPDEVKHELYSTKVMAYREELRTSVTHSVGKSAGGGKFTGLTDSKSMGGKMNGMEQFDPEAWNESLATSAGDSHTWTESESESETQSSVLIPVFGKELAHVQFRSLEEQLFRAMAVLFDQQERHGVARLTGMSAPVSIVTPEVVQMPSTPERIKKFLDLHYAKLPFALTSATAQKQIAQRKQEITELLLKPSAQEPKSAKRKLR